MKNKKILIPIILLMVALLGVGVYYFYRNQPVAYTPLSEGGQERDVNTIDYNPPTESQQNAAQDATPKTLEEVESLSVTITSANQLSGVLTVRALITPLIGSGKCTLTLNRARQPTITQEAEVQAVANAATCKGFSVPTGSIAKGTWELTVSAVETSGKAGSSSRSIEIQ